MTSTWAMLLPVASAAALYLVRLQELGARRGTIPGKIVERATLRWFILTGTMMLVGALAEYFWRGPILRWWTFLPGWLCALASFALRRLAIAALGQFWSLHVEIRAEHQFVRSGPFRWVRHPTYLSMILELLALGWLLNAPCATMVGMVLLAPALRRRLRLEEAALVEQFGAAYQEYQRSTPALFPYKRPLRS
jgi:protein-S-isoprenylcysteine O-methyltransferase Ste14